MLYRADVSNNPLRKVDLPHEMVPHPTRLKSENSKLALASFHTAYSQTLQPICAHSCTDY
jgi:hypothetical protein